MNKRRTAKGQRNRRGQEPAAATLTPVPLHTRCRTHFKPEERERGTEYFDDSQVVLEIDGSCARARVEAVYEENPEVNRVRIDWSRVSERRVHVYCECRRFAGRALCGHIWAVLLELGEAGPKQQPPGKDRLGLRKDRAASWEELLQAVGRGEVVSQGTERGPELARAKSVHFAGPTRQRPAAAGKRGPASAIAWRSHLAALNDELNATSEPIQMPSPAARSALTFQFAINTSTSLESSGLVLDVFRRASGSSRKPGGKATRASIEQEELERHLLPPVTKDGPVSDPELALVTVLPGASPRRKTAGQHAAKGPSGIRRLLLPQRLYESVLPHLCEQRALSWWDGRSEASLRPLRWDRASAWQLALHLEVAPDGVGRLSGALERKGESLPLSAPVLILAPTEAASNDQSLALVVFAETIGRLELDRRRDLPWIKRLGDGSELMIPMQEVGQALSELLALPVLPRLEMPENLDLVEEASPPQPRLAFESKSQPAHFDGQIAAKGSVIKRATSTTSAQAVAPPIRRGAAVSQDLPPAPSDTAVGSVTRGMVKAVAKLSFDYGALRVSAEDSRTSIIDWQERRLLRRNLESEQAALVRLLELGLEAVESDGGDVQALELDRHKLPLVIEPLLQEGWSVEVQGRSVRPPNPPNLRIESGIDWFDLSGQVSFAGDQLELSKLLDSVSRGDRFIALKDGSQGLLPASWMETYGSLAQVARESTDSGLRFLFSQALIVDALLTAMPPADVDAAFDKLRQKLSSFERIKPKKEPRSFGGTLRTYQRHGLGWLNFLREFGIGGVLADDMGLGKTVQVLALIKTHRAPSKTTKMPFLVVAPRSVVYNWIDEAARFTPKLRAIEYHGAGREELRERFGEVDIIVTTYGTLRRDVSYLATVEFDTVILDEAQTIKNPASQTAKAARLLSARHRLALTGTPIENHLGDLGSIFEFLNPGMLGRLPRLEVLTAGRAPQKHELLQLAEDLRPFILRRTKAQVLPDLPPKTEQILLCTMRSEQHEIYSQMRATYQASLLEQVEKKGVAGSAIQVLEAMLRLRQVACHPGLVDPSWEEAGSAKLETLFEQVSEVLKGGHKVLIFSQFTTLLGYVRRHLDELEMPYAYLDGKTRKRGELVERFQTDPACNLFLISLKAGGVGLNLTAAGYVFLLDPWWNPAVEAQAIDRTHRIGQTQPVFAYRLIARDTVEEKLLELQRAKRNLADAILEGEGQSLRDLTADDLRLLLS